MFPFYIDEIIRLASQEWTTGCRKNYFLDPVSCFTHQALKNSRVLRIDRYHRNLFLYRPAHYNITGNHQGFLICQCDVLARVYGRKDGGQAGKTKNRAEHYVYALTDYREADYGVLP